MVVRIKLTQDVYLPLDGQWQVVQCGSVIDVPDNFGISRVNTSVLGEQTGNLASHGKPTPVRDIRKK